MNQFEQRRAAAHPSIDWSELNYQDDIDEDVAPEAAVAFMKEFVALCDRHGMTVEAYADFGSVEIVKTQPEDEAEQMRWYRSFLAGLKRGLGDKSVDPLDRYGNDAARRVLGR